MKLDIKTLEYMSDRVKRGNKIQSQISDLLQGKKTISLNTEIKIYIGGGSYQDLLDYSQVRAAITNLIDSRVAKLEQEFEQI
jgi:hypothetical protein